MWDFNKMIENAVGKAVKTMIVDPIRKFMAWILGLAYSFLGWVFEITWKVLSSKYFLAFVALRPLNEPLDIANNTSTR